MINKSILFILILVILISNSCNYVQNRMNELKESDISGIVIEKYQEKLNHGSPVVKLNSGVVFGVVSWAKDSYLWEQIEIGDSISKPPGTTDLTLFKKNGDYFLYKFNE
jgi:hypothetical protein